MLPSVKIEPKQVPQASVIWLHGLGADGHDLAGITSALTLTSKLAVRFIFPHAPQRRITYWGGKTTRAWFDVINLELDAKEDKRGIQESMGLINQLVEAEIAQGIPSDKIVLAGFSQGGAMALQCGLRYPKKLAGILVLSAWLPLNDTVAQERSSCNQATPILMQHGIQDDIIPLFWAEQSQERLKTLGYNVILATYPMQHSLCEPEMAAIDVWLQQVFHK